MSFQAQPGTIQFRAMTWLQAQPTGTEVTASIWGEAINVDGTTLITCIKPAIEAGAVRRRAKDGMQRPLWFSLSENQPAGRVVSASSAHTAVAPVAAAKAPSAAPTPPVPAAAPTKRVEEPRLSPEQYVGRIGSEQPHADPVNVPFNACRYVDGSVIVVGVEVREDGAIIFAPKQAQALWRLRDAA